MVRKCETCADDAEESEAPVARERKRKTKTDPLQESDVPSARERKRKTDTQQAAESEELGEREPKRKSDLKQAEESEVSTVQHRKRKTDIEETADSEVPVARERKQKTKTEPPRESEVPQARERKHKTDAQQAMESESPQLPERSKLHHENVKCPGAKDDEGQRGQSEQVAEADRRTACLPASVRPGPVSLRPVRGPQPQSLRAQRVHAPASKSLPRVYVLDALNIMRHRNVDEGELELKWEQLFAAGEYYKTRGDVFAFVPPMHKEDAKNFVTLRERVGSSCIVTTPLGQSDDAFMISFAMDMERSGRSVKVITNDRFKDHGGLGVDPAWVHRHTVKFAFAGPIFIPGERD